MIDSALIYTAFEDRTFLLSGRLEEVAIKVKKRLEAHPSASILVFNDLSGKLMDLDLRGTEAEILTRLRVFISSDKDISTTAGPGRPKLGVVAREISLLPRQWEWLSTQMGGASATIRRLVDEAKKISSGKEIIRNAQERAHRFMSAIAGDLPDYEEALRALYAKDRPKFNILIEGWPVDIREYTKSLAAAVWE